MVVVGGGVGLHLILDGTAPIAPDFKMMDRCIQRIVRAIGLKIVHGPLFFTLQSYREVFVIVATSHVCIKAFDSGLVLVDVFSCEQFDIEAIRVLIATSLKLDKYVWRELKRAGTGE